MDVVIGTHAVTHAVAKSGVEFKKLGLVVIDEQHKFGVRQRAALKKAGVDPHYLVMTATPIPRTVGMTLFGDLDVSTLREPPPGRQTVHTLPGRRRAADAVVAFFSARSWTRGGRDMSSRRWSRSRRRSRRPMCRQTFETLGRGELANYRLGLLHGRMTPAEKDSTMQAFRSGRTQVLVATSVVEVGVDVPNATLMTIEGGERFGLAQLHQLRGRISRGAHPGYLCVFATPASDEAQERLDAFTKTSDGFELAEIDFRLRGPGDLFGTRQHGLPPLRIADLRRDVAVVEEARARCAALIQSDPELANPAFARLRRMVFHRYGEALGSGRRGITSRGGTGRWVG